MFAIPFFPSTIPPVLPKARHFIITLSAVHSVFTPSKQLLNNVIIYCKGQLELGEGGFLHWQFVISCSKQCRITQIKAMLPPGSHIEATRSEAAREYVWKEDTRIPGTQFEFGDLPVRRNSQIDWDSIKTSAVEGKLLVIFTNF